jgi:hypothetical protein
MSTPYEKEKDNGLAKNVEQRRDEEMEEPEKDTLRVRGGLRYGTDHVSFGTGSMATPCATTSTVCL